MTAGSLIATMSMKWSLKGKLQCRGQTGKISRIVNLVGGSAWSLTAERFPIKSSQVLWSKKHQQPSGLRGIEGVIPIPVAGDN